MFCRDIIITQSLKYYMTSQKMKNALLTYSDEYIQKRIDNNTIRYTQNYKNYEKNAIDGTLCELAFEYALNNDTDENEPVVNIYSDIEEGSFKKEITSNLKCNENDFKYLDYVYLLNKKQPKIIEIKSSMLYHVDGYDGNTFVNLIVSCMKAKKNVFNDYVVLFTNNYSYGKNDNNSFYTSTLNDIEVQFFGIVNLKTNKCEFINTKHVLSKKSRHFFSDFSTSVENYLTNNLTYKDLCKNFLFKKIGDDIYE